MDEAVRTRIAAVHTTDAKFDALFSSIRVFDGHVYQSTYAPGIKLDKGIIFDQLLIHIFGYKLAGIVA